MNSSKKHKKIKYKITRQKVHNIVDYTNINFNNYKQSIRQKKAINQNTRVVIFDNTYKRSFN